MNEEKMTTCNDDVTVEVAIDDGGFSNRTVALIGLVVGAGLTAAGKWTAKKIRKIVDEHKAKKEVKEGIEVEPEKVEVADSKDETKK